MKILLFPICLIKGHKLDFSGDLAAGISGSDENWLCPCTRCGLYQLRDGAGSGIKMTMTKKEAVKFIEGFKQELMETSNF